MENFIKNKFQDPLKRLIMIEFIKDKKQSIEYHFSNEISLKIDEKIILPLISPDQVTQLLTQNIKRIVREIKDEFSYLVDASLSVYNRTLVGQYTDFESYIILIVNNFLNKCTEPSILQYFKDQYRDGIRFFSLSNQIQILSQFWLPIRDALCALFCSLDEDYDDVVGFLFKKFNRNLKYEMINPE